MPWIRFLKPKNPGDPAPRPAVDVAPGTNLMKALLAAGLPVASSCRGDGVCGKCRIQIVDGAQNLSSPGPNELRLKERFSIGPGERVSCQSEILGDITVDTTYW